MTEEFDDADTHDEHVDDASGEGEEFDATDFEMSAADRRLAAIAAGRRKGGVAGAAMAGAMMAISEIYEGPKRDEIVAVSETPDKPTDIDSDGIEVSIGEVDVMSKPPSADDAGA